ncbi:MAG: type II secretion system protein J [Candidatus Aminicenantales bacterium]
MEKRASKKEEGFTLLELIFVVALGSLIMAALIGLYSTGQRYYVTESARSDIIREGRSVLLWMSRDIKESVQVVESYDVYSTSTSSLVLKVPSIDANGDIIDVDTEFDYIIYRLNPDYPSKLERKVLPKAGVSSRSGSNKVLATKVNSFTLKSGGSELSGVADLSTVESIEISVVLQEIRFGRTFQETLNTLVKLRNKEITSS